MWKSLLLFLITSGAYAQYHVQGSVKDLETQEPLAFANLFFNDDPNLQTISDVDGNFSYQSHLPLLKVTTGYVGYEPISIPLEGVLRDQLDIGLQSKAELLAEVDISADDPEALRIIVQTMKNKTRNNPESLPGFQYDCYNKMWFDFLYFKNQRDSVMASKLFKNSHLLLTETHSRRKYRRPVYNKEEILATRVSGVKNPEFATLATDFQPFAFYDDYLKLLDLRYLNPLAKGALSRYRYKLESQMVSGNDTIFTIAFLPRKGKTQELLQGVLHIHSDRYAIQDVVAKPAEKAKVSLSIRQQYRRLESGQWFPEQLHYLLTIEGYPNATMGIYAEGRSVISKVHIKQDLRPRDFSVSSLKLHPEAAKRDSSYWQSIRPAALSKTEYKTFHTLDSIGQSFQLDRYAQIMAKIGTGRMPIGFVDLDLNKTFGFNRYEGFRPGLGLFTNDEVSRHFELGVHLGYGTKDQAWKYGMGVTAFLLPNRNLTLQLSYLDDLRELSIWQEAVGVRPLWFDLRRFIGYRYEQIKQTKIALEGAVLPFLKGRFEVGKSNVTPCFEYGFVKEGKLYERYVQTELALHLRYAYGWFDNQQPSLVATNGAPVLQLSYFKGLQDSRAGFAYNKVTASVAQSHYFRYVGWSQYRLEAGYSSADVPAGVLFSGSGSKDDNVPFVMPNHFQTMLPYEFLSSQYIQMFGAHQFGNLLYRNKWFEPRISILHNMGWSRLKNPAQHLGVAFKDMRKGYFESGLKLDYILRANYANIGTMGLGAAVFYRYGAYENSKTQDNLAFKCTLNFSLK